METGAAALAFEALPPTMSNRAALARIDYAADDRAALRERLLRRLPAMLPGWNPALAADGRGDDATLLVELFSQLAAILDGYADQRANEAFLRTATQQRSLIDLCALVDYRLGSGASASALQAFFAKPGKSGSIAAGFQLATPPAATSTDRADLVFETLAPLSIDPSRNAMRLVGHDRSGRTLRLRSDPAATQDTIARMDAIYPGLRAGVPMVFDDGATLIAVPIAAALEEAGASVVRWPAGASSRDAVLAIGDLSLRARPRQSMKLAASAGADEIALGRSVLPVRSVAGLSRGDAVLVCSGALRLAARVTAIDPVARTISIDRGVPVALRRSATLAVATTLCGATSGVVPIGSIGIPFNKHVGTTDLPRSGDLLLMADATGVELGTVAEAFGEGVLLTQPLVRALRPVTHSLYAKATVRFFFVAPDQADDVRNTLRPALLGELGGTYATGDTMLALDRSYEGLTVGSVVALADGHLQAALRVRAVDNVGGRTVLRLEGEADRRLQVATLDISGPFEHAMRIAGHDRSDAVLAAGAAQLDLVGTPAGLAAGLDLVVADASGAEGARVTQVIPVGQGTRIVLASPLENRYAIGDAVVYGNVAEITHGASGADETLGSGDASAAPQRFTLRKPSLAFVAAPGTPRGVEPAVEIWIAGERWTRVESLAGSGPLDRHYVLEIDEQERAAVQFGDGTHGAPVSTGRNNVVARYRTGHGLAANRGPSTIVKMVKAVDFIERTINPVAASGGAERETPQVARQQVVHRVRTLDRAVSLDDYAQLALACEGIAMARADLEREGSGAAGRRVIVVTCAPDGGTALSTPQKEALLAYLAARSGEPSRLRVRDHRVWPVRLALRVELTPDRRQVDVQRALNLAFGGDADADGFFAFGRRGLGDDIALSDVYAAAEAVAGVDHALAIAFHAESDAPSVADRIVVPADAVATGGDPVDATVGRLALQLVGGVA